MYIPAFWNRPATPTAEPARAVRSVVDPDPRDKSSNAYRDIETLNLKIDIRDNHHLGAGFGIPVVHKFALPVDLTGAAVTLTYVTHDTVLWVWLRMGFVGSLSFLAIIGAATIRACQLTKLSHADPESAILGAVVACSLVAYLIMGVEDLGIAWLRIALCVGALLGAMEARLKALEQVGLARGGTHTADRVLVGQPPA